MIIMTVAFYLGRRFSKHPSRAHAGEVSVPVRPDDARRGSGSFTDLVDIQPVDLYVDEHQEDEYDAL